MAEGAVYFGAVAGSYASGLCYAKFGYQVASPVSKFLHTKSLYTIVISTRTQQGINMMWTAYSTKTKPNLPESTPLQTS